MMNKNNLLMFGFVAILLLSLGFSSALENVTLSVVGVGSSSDARVTDLNGTTHEVTLRLNNSNQDYSGGAIELLANFSGGSGKIAFLTNPQDVPFGINDYKINVTLPDETKDSYWIVTAKFYNSTESEINQTTTRIYYSSTKPSTNDNNDNNDNDDDESNLFCKEGTLGNVEIGRIRDKRLDNDDKWEWRALDRVELEIKVKNTFNDDDDYDDEDFVVEIAFKDNNFNTVDIAEDDDDLEYEVYIREDDDEKITVTFEVDGEVEEGRYDMYVKAYLEGEEDTHCYQTFEEIEIIKDKHDVIVKSVDGDATVEEDTTQNYELLIANIGREDQEKVKITAYNKDLGINEVVILSDLYEGDSERVNFNLEIPEGSDGNHIILFYVEFNYDDRSEIYRDNSNEYRYTLTVLESTKPVAPSVTANLESEAKVNEELVIKTIITNNGPEGNLVFSLTGYESWATLMSISPQTANLDEGESTEIVITLIPKSSGLQTFNLESLVGGETFSKSISVTIPVEEKGLFGDLGSWVIYLIVAIAVLVILILLVAVIKLSRAPRRKQEF